MKVHQNRGKKKHTMNLTEYNSFLLYWLCDLVITSCTKKLLLNLYFKENHTKFDSSMAHTINMLYTFLGEGFVRRRNRVTVDDRCVCTGY